MPAGYCIFYIVPEGPLGLASLCGVDGWEKPYSRHYFTVFLRTLADWQMAWRGLDFWETTWTCEEMKRPFCLEQFY